MIDDGEKKDGAFKSIQRYTYFSSPKGAWIKLYPGAMLLLANHTHSQAHGDPGIITGPTSGCRGEATNPSRAVGSRSLPPSAGAIWMHWLCQQRTPDWTLLLQQLLAVAEEQEVWEQAWWVEDIAWEEGPDQVQQDDWVQMETLVWEHMKLFQRGWSSHGMGSQVGQGGSCYVLPLH
ncbi:hypothetical protein Y1Q_0005098 [Alligator mississippiensis]|uniref:Uncharacterized protein n=1 Tax=Alligator mississippiensis TaxID=8496 RepID=A0A151MUH2_ALLMI|nr:hypothetical protein Y1Q_0005098 [Alligator mississippiensis]